MEEAIKDILYSLRSHLQRQEGTTMLEEDQRGLPWLPHGPAAELDPTLRALRPEGGTAHVMRPSGKLRRHPSGCWELPPYWS